MKYSILTLLLWWLTLASQGLSAQQQPAFPGAQGHGRYTTGGRGGEVYYVTSLEDNRDQVGTLRYGLENSAMNKARTILFKVSGTIHLTKALKIMYGNVTIAGQSAPGDGITLRGFPVTIAADNVIVRYIRFRMGDLDDISADGADAFGARGVKNVMVDHCSLSWCTDECGSFYQNQNFTMQWCIISESLRLSKHAKGAHGYGGIWGGTDASFLHNLMANHDSRNPRLGPSSTSTAENERVDMRNNVIYNWCSNSCYGGEAMNVNIVNNYYKPGPATPTGSKRGRIVSIDKKTDGSMPAIENIWGTFYIDGNVVDDGKNEANCIRATNYNWDYGVLNQFASKYGTVPQEEIAKIRRSEPVPFDVVYGHSARVAYEKVLDYSGASLKRDAVDVRIVDETRNGTTHFTGKNINNVAPYPKPGLIDSQQDLMPDGADETWSAWPVLNSTTAPVDTDGDGMPDSWENTNGLDYRNASDGKLVVSGGYTNLEKYLNSLVQSITTEQMKDLITAVEQPLVAQLPVRLYPNPTDGRSITIEAASIITSIRVFNLAGALLFDQACDRSSVSLDLPGVAKGIFLVTVQCAGQTAPESLKLILK